tara:strand:+ start:3517 stop:5907 length:2391 start_codon:yes stop_codon:yes gene_type:complete
LTGQNSFWFANPSTGFYNDVIDQSLRFNKADGAELTRTPSSAGNRKTWTLSTWVKRSGDSDAGGSVLLGAFASSYSDFIYFDTSDRLSISFGNAHTIGTNAVFRDKTNWFHVVVAVDVTESTDTDRVKIYINGTQQTLQVLYSSFPANQNYAWNNTVIHTVGGLANFSGYQFDGYLAEYNFIDGSALTPSSFGETKNGVWIPKEISGLTYGTNGFRLTFADSSDIGNNANSTDGTNDYSPSSLASTDVVPDSPENNFATLNHLQQRSNSSATFSEGNLKAVGASASVSGIMTGTFGVSSGKWYWEVLAGGSPYLNTGVVSTPFDPTSTGDSGILSNEYVYLRNGNKYNSNSSASYGASYADGDIIGVALDLDNDTLTFYKNNSSQGTAYSSLPSGTYLPIFDCYNGSSWILNAGQDSSFAGAKTAQGNTDANGQGDFFYSVPSNHLALCSSNLPDTTISPNQDTQADDHFNTVLWSGNATARDISVGFEADWVWTKMRSHDNAHYIYDSSRGDNTDIYSNLTQQESTTSGRLTFGNTDGFSVGTNAQTNGSGYTFVGWCWKANGGTTSSNTDGTITSTVQASQTAGFSIVLWNGEGDSQATVGHGLGAVPKVIIPKNRDATGNWHMYHADIDASAPEDYGILLNAQNARSDDSGFHNDTAPTSSVFTVGTYNNFDNDYVAYVFAEIEGYSKFGSYTGNGSTDGTFVYTGFRPAWILVKSSSNAEPWNLVDIKRDTFNVMGNYLQPNTSGAEGTLAFVDGLSNGFKLRSSGSGFNGSGYSFIYMAFAEQPFKFSNAR